MRLHPREIEIRSLTNRQAQVLLHGEAADLHANLGGGAIQIRLTNGEDWVVATALLSPGIQQSSEVAAKRTRNIS